MSSGTTVFKGVVRGRVIELDHEPGFPDGQSVSVTLRADDAEPVPGEGLRRAFGAWADKAEEVDRFLEWNRQQRKRGRAALGPRSGSALDIRERRNG